MAWREQDRVSLRAEAVALIERDGLAVAEVARRYGVSRKTLYKWLDRIEEDPVGGLFDRSRRPHTSPRQTPMTMVDEILRCRRETGWGGRKLHRYLRNQGMVNVPSPATITAILHRHGGSDPTTMVTEPVHTWARFTATEPNALWQMDFKGSVFAGTRAVHPLLILDDYSRFVVSATVELNQQHDTVRTAVERVFRRYGLPARILTDNGSPWGTSHDISGRPLTRLGVWFVRLGIRISHGRPYHPQTQGKVERCMRTLGAEALQQTAHLDVSGLQGQLDRWRDRYNQHRPHEALGLDRPIDHYHLSPRTYPDQVPPMVYAPTDEVRRVNAKGFIKFADKWFFVSQALTAEMVAIRPTDEEGHHMIWLGGHPLRIIDEANPSDLNWV
jgi:transposase InsO family protein